MTTKILMALGAAFLVGTAAGYLLRQLLAQQRKDSVELKIKQLILDAKDEAQKIVGEAKEKAESTINTSRTEIKEREGRLRLLEERITQKENVIQKETGEIASRKKVLDTETEGLKKRIEKLQTIEEQKRKELEKVAGLSESEAKESLFASLEKKFEEDIVARIKKLETFGKEKMEQKARDILAAIIQRLAPVNIAELTTTTVQIPSEDIKGKIIGKEGRNIRAFERAAGVEVVIDDTPGSIVISSFDPVRRHIAKIALENLILDGRIQPARIEETVEKAKTEAERIIKDAGESAIYEIGVFDLDPRLIMLLGRLHFRTSFGQNVLQHSIEMAHIAGMLAEELKADVTVAKKGALLHDIGKAVDHDIPGTHVEIGRRILKKFGVDENVVKAMQAHHEEYPYETVESIIVQTADAISGGRPGARRDSIENYLKRLEDLERIANSFEGIEKSYAIQAGREIRIFVSPEAISDVEAKNLARKIADRVEQELKYPGEIKVHVIRETRVIEYAR
ncbi:MAG: ribonuclease Y [Candidatus Niyogibacteria bacterium]|nr:ribonuclease Y [Candidatus Niyogibacteria bacterium]